MVKLVSLYVIALKVTDPNNDVKGHRVDSFLMGVVPVTMPYETSIETAARMHVK